MEPRATNWAQLAAENDDYRRVVLTTPYAQVSLMRVDDQIPQETHEYATQIITVVAGKARVYFGAAHTSVRAGESIVVPPGTTHTVVARAGEPLRLYSIYAPPLHPRDARAATRADDRE